MWSQSGPQLINANNPDYNLLGNDEEEEMELADNTYRRESASSI